MSLAAYVRVSHNDQNEASQKMELNRWIASNGVNLSDVRWFFDKGKSGDNLSRQGYQNMMGAIMLGEIKTVVVYKLDRLSRSIRDGVLLIYDLLDRGVRLVSTSQQIDMSGPFGRMMASVFFGLAECEQHTRRERQAAGIRAAKLEGRKWGGSKKGTLLVVKPEQIEWVVQMKRYGRTVSYISRATGLSRQTVYRILERAEPVKIEKVIQPRSEVEKEFGIQEGGLMVNPSAVPAESIDFPVP